MQVSHDVRANFARFYFLQLSLNSLIYVAFVSHCAARGNFLAMCLRTSAKVWRHFGDGFTTYAMTWRRFCDDFCRTKKVLHV